MAEFQPYVPEDFDEFWAEIVEETLDVPLYFKRETTDRVSPTGHLVDKILFCGAEGHPLEGWIAYPASAKRVRSFLWIPPYGRESLLPNEYGTREGFVSMSLNLHGLSAFHQEKYEVSRGYFAEGALSPESWVFRRLIQHVLVALRVLQAQSEVDEERIGAMGMSQGAGLAIWAGAMSSIVKAVAADMPFLAAMPFALSRNAYRYPLKELVDLMEDAPLGRERVMHTLSYFDTLNMATRCKLPTLVTYGEKDPACRPETVESVFDALASDDKKLIAYPGGHDWHQEMVQNNSAWLASRM
ncbi:MAG: acetylxylan esterase [Chthonomonas sp.]|nr:acetylxylan esterase [Chthonomonas sp.]